MSAAGWYYVLLVAAFVLFAAYVGLSRFGQVRLGADDEEPEFGLRSWFAMLFSAGMGIGLVFWGVAEPLNHLASPPPGTDPADPGEAAQNAMTTTFLHWGVHAWAIYVVVGLSIAYAVHRRGRPVSIRWALEPLFGDRVRGRVGDLVDVVAVVGTLFGVATSLGFGVLQISAGLETLGVVDSSSLVQVLLIAGITALAIVSVVTGLGKGIKWLSNANLVLAAAILVFVLVAGPTLFLLRSFVADLGSYLQNLAEMTFTTGAFGGQEALDWQGSWTAFYWGWWISWAPFVGVFIARISRGRTVREFVAGVLLVPTLVTLLWFSVLGGTALYRQVEGEGGLIGSDGSVSTDTALFEMLQGLPFSTVVVSLSVVLVVTFFVTSSDSGSLVIDMLSSGGDPDPPTWSRAFWATTEGVVAAALLLAGAAATSSGDGTGGLAALQAVSVTVALPFTVVTILMMIALYRALDADSRRLSRNDHLLRTTAVVSTVLRAGRDGESVDVPADVLVVEGDAVERARREQEPAGQQ